MSKRHIHLLRGARQTDLHSSSEKEGKALMKDVGSEEEHEDIGEDESTNLAVDGADTATHSNLRRTKSALPPLIKSGAQKLRHKSLAQPGFSPVQGYSSSRMQVRSFHASQHTSQHAATAASAAIPEEVIDIPPPPPPRENLTGIRAQLHRWQEVYGKEADAKQKSVDFDQDRDGDNILNTFTRLPDPSQALRQQEHDNEEEESRAAFANYHGSSSSTDEDGSSAIDGRFLAMGDLVELEFVNSERESMLAVFVRKIGQDSQFFTMQGRWMHLREKSVQYSVPGWVDPKLVEPLLDHLPTEDDVQDLEGLRNHAYLEDLSVPREKAAPLVSRMVQFHTESQAIYRQHASALDDAYGILGHETDLRYGSLTSAATTLLRMPAEKLPVTALFTVRKALSHAGFAFNIDRRSHRLTGYLQIRSKEQVRMVEQVRGWLRSWQNDMALRSALGSDELALAKHRTSKGAQYVYDFIEKARKIALKSREDRKPTASGNIGPSKKRFPITPDSDSVRMTRDTQFSEQDTEIVRFMESWCCSMTFVGLPRLEALPPLILQATGLYPDLTLNLPTGFLFLQELGTIMPYENRVRFDQHLLLPSSQHSKPLQALMSSVMEMQNNHNFQDTMKGLRKDWGSLPIYCIDGASAHEIDDGLSIEEAAPLPNGKRTWWAHIHIANPTAHFARDHPLAKMARHMGESIYMPERAYMMLPRWATAQHFSLAKDRPCLTFSARIDEDGEKIAQEVCAGVVRNVLMLTLEDVEKLLGGRLQETRPETVYQVGGEPPPPRGRTTHREAVTSEQVEELKMLRHLSGKRFERRTRSGGVIFDAHVPEVEVWQSWKMSGLAWDHPYRKGARHIEGDPVIQFRTRGFINWFAPSPEVANVLVREMMLLACEVAASWCAERQVPAIFRGTIRKPDRLDPEIFRKEILEPVAARSPNGEIPMHLGIPYVQSLGNTKLSSKPLRHRVLSMDYYSKVSSPLRRYGDMILHWQIEAALREEARTGHSLQTSDPKVDRSFLPFSAAVLETIIVGLQPRELLIHRAKTYAENFWATLLLFRAFFFDECDLPFRSNARLYISSNDFGHMAIGCQSIDLNVSANMEFPEKYGLGKAQYGDVWECELVDVHVFKKVPIFRPIRLLERAEQSGFLALAR